MCMIENIMVVNKASYFGCQYINIQATSLTITYLYKYKHKHYKKYLTV